MKHGQGGEVSPVPDGLHPRDRTSSLLERVRLGPRAQHRSLYGDRLHMQLPREGSHKLTHGAQAPAPPTTVRPHVGVRDLRNPMEGRAETTCKVEEEERVDIGGHVETRQ